MPLIPLLLATLLAFSPLAALAASPAQLGTRRNTAPAEQNAESSPQAAVAQGTESLLLGQYANVPMVRGESISFEITIPESGSYLITAVDDDAATDFELLITDEAGNELYNDLFATTELALEAGTLNLTFTAVADNTLFMVMVGQIGTMSDDERQPGKLLPGSVFIGEGISEARYATFTVPETPYPQQVLVYMEAGDGDTFYGYADGDNVYASITTDTDNILSFWTQGGDYSLYIDPYDRRSDITLIVFLSGRPAPITVDEPREAALAANATQLMYELQLDTNYTDLELRVESDADMTVTLMDSYYDSQVYYSSYGEESVTIDALFPGVYYVLVEIAEESDSETPFTLTVTGTPGRPTVALTSGIPADDEFVEGETAINYSFAVTNPGSEVIVTLSGADEDTDFDLSIGLRPGSGNWSTYTYGSDETIKFVAPIAGTYYLTVQSNDGVGPFTLQVDEGNQAPTLESGVVNYDFMDGTLDNIYLLPIEEGNQLLSVALVGPADVDFDLSVDGYNARGDTILSLAGYSSGSAEIVSYIVTEPGNYVVTVSPSYAEDGGYYFLQAQVVDPRLFGGQWAIDAVASSEGTDGAALQAAGPSDTFSGDSATAWAAAEDDAGTETLELTFTVPVVPHLIGIAESLNPGAITQIEAYDLDNDAWVTIYTGDAAPIEEATRFFIPDLTAVDFATDQLRLTLDTSAVPGANQIDAVQLFGRP
jgi:hypothetical protein